MFNIAASTLKPQEVLAAHLLLHCVLAMTSNNNEVVFLLDLYSRHVIYSAMSSLAGFNCSDRIAGVAAFNCSDRFAGVAAAIQSLALNAATASLALIAAIEYRIAGVANP